MSKTTNGRAADIGAKNERGNFSALYTETETHAQNCKRELVSDYYALKFGNGEILDEDFMPSSRADCAMIFDTPRKAFDFSRDNFPCSAVHLWERYRHGQPKPYGVKVVEYDEKPTVVHVQIFTWTTEIARG